MRGRESRDREIETYGDWLDECNDKIKNYEAELQRMKDQKEHWLDMAVYWRQESRSLKRLLYKLFNAYQDLDEDTLPDGVLPLESIHDLMPDIQRALTKEEPDA